ncbi:hypothetical protein PMAYCL1PPCAC_01471, partial [Pristionchus mayeri]
HTHPTLPSLPLSDCSSLPMWSSTLVAAAAATLFLAALPITEASSSLDCSSRPDGFFSIGCSSSFTSCKAGRSNSMTCPDDLVYDEERQKCEYPGNVKACGGAPEEGSGMDEGSGDGSGEGSGVEDGSGEGSGEIE